MGVNLLEIFKDVVGDQVVNQASGFLDETTDKTGSALEAILPSLLVGLLKKGGDQDSAAGILDFMKTHNVDDSLLDNLGELFSGSQATNRLLESGSGILDFLFGKNSGMLGNILDQVTSQTGIGRSSSSSLTKMVAPPLMGVLSQYVKEKALDAAGLSELLGEQKEHIAAAAPTGMLEKLGLGSMLSTTDKVSEIVENNAPDTNSSTTSTIAAAQTGSNLIGKIGPWIILVTVAMLLWYVMRSCGGQPASAVHSMTDQPEKMAKGAEDKIQDPSMSAEKAADVSTDVIEKVEEVVADATRSVANGIASINLPSGQSIEIKEGSFLDQVHSYIISTEFDAEKRFNFDNLTFNPESSTLLEESMTQIANTAALLDAFPRVHVRIEGHTDNTGNANTNLSISEQRSLAVKRALNESGVSIERLKAIGHGQQKPIASNDTEEGKKQNRRVDFFVTKK